MATPRAFSVVNGAGTTTFGGAVGTTPLASLTTDALGTTDINGGAVTTTGFQSYGNAVVLTADLLAKSTAGGNVTFAKTVDSDAVATPRASRW